MRSRQEAWIGHSMSSRSLIASSAGIADKADGRSDVDESEKRRIDLIRRLAEMPDDDEPHPDWILTEEEGRQLLDILCKGAPAWVRDIRERIERERIEDCG